MAVTERMGVGAIVRMTWSPERAPGGHHDHAEDGMSGRVTGVHVCAASGAQATPMPAEPVMRETPA
jgi:hypothetical protein